MKQGQIKKIAKQKGYRLGSVCRTSDCCRMIRQCLLLSGVKEGDIYTGINTITDDREAVIVVKADNSRKSNHVLHKLIPISQI